MDAESPDENAKRFKLSRNLEEEWRRADKVGQVRRCGRWTAAEMCRRVHGADSYSFDHAGSSLFAGRTKFLADGG